MKKLNQKGFGHLYILIVVVVLVVIGASGWFVYSKNTSANTKTNNSKKSSDNNLTSNSSSDKYLEYSNKDLGFAFTYPKILGTAETTLSNSAKSDIVENATDSYWFTAFSNKDYGISIRGASAKYTNSHGVDDIAYARGFTSESTKYIPACLPAGENGGDLGNCQLLGNNKDVLYAKFKSPIGFDNPAESIYVVMNLDKNDYNINAIRILFVGDQITKLGENEILKLAGSLHKL